MAITNQAQLLAAMEGGQQIVWHRGGSQGTVNLWASTIVQAGTPPAASIAGVNTANGIVPDDTTAGFPALNGFGAGNTGYLGSIALAINSTANTSSLQRQRLVDMLFKAGAYSFNSAVTLTAQPSYAARIPNSDYKGTEIWFECTGTFTGSPTITVTYTNQDGVAGQTATASFVAPALGIMRQLSLAAGDTGVQKIESVTATVATVGTFNILVVRPLWMGVVVATGDYDYVFYGPDKTKLPIVFATSALYWQSWNSGGAAFGPDGIVTIING